MHLLHLILLWRRHLLSNHVVFDNLVEFCNVRMILIEDLARVHVINLQSTESLKRAP
jgi:hypothetical protein